jgi:hypothetical protein
MEAASKPRLMQWHTSFWVFTVFIVTVFILAYLGLIPRKIKAIPFYDSIGHFTLYGLWALLLDQALGKRDAGVGKMCLPWAIIIMGGIATAEELLQALSGLRTVSIGDWSWGVTGITVFVVTNRTAPHHGS